MKSEEKTMTESEFVNLMRQQGCNAEAVDNDDVVLIPIYDGITDDHGCISQEMYRVPRAIAPDCNFIVRLADDRLADYRMHKGDELRMRNRTLHSRESSYWPFTTACLPSRFISRTRTGLNGSCQATKRVMPCASTRTTLAASSAWLRPGSSSAARSVPKTVPRR